jgi:hypothetical protein
VQNYNNRRVIPELNATCARGEELSVNTVDMLLSSKSGEGNAELEWSIA